MWHTNTAPVGAGEFRSEERSSLGATQDPASRAAQLNIHFMQSQML